MNGRKALLRDYRDRKVEAGIYAVRCIVSGQAWVGATPDLSTRQGGLWFTLRHGTHRDQALQAAWTAHGEAAFAYEPLDVLSDETLGALGRSSWLQDRKAVWIERLGARGLNR